MSENEEKPKNPVWLVIVLMMVGAFLFFFIRNLITGRSY